MALSGALSSFAWKARGPGFANEVTEEGWKLFAERSEEAERVLMGIDNKRHGNMNWYDAMHVVAKARGWKIDRYSKYFEEAVKLEPLYWDFYQDKAVYLLPRWYGKRVSGKNSRKKLPTGLAGKKETYFIRRSAGKFEDTRMTFSKRTLAFPGKESRGDSWSVNANMVQVTDTSMHSV